MLPLGWFLAIRCSFGLVGLWGAMSGGWLVATVLYLLTLIFTDWQAQANVAKQRNTLGMMATSEEQQVSDGNLPIRNSALVGSGHLAPGLDSDDMMMELVSREFQIAKTS